MSDKRGLFHARAFRILGAVLAGVFAATLSASAAFFTDTEFADGDWSLTEIADTYNTGTATAEHRDTGGFPEAYRYGSHTQAYSAEYSLLRNAHLPAAAGAIVNLAAMGGLDQVSLQMDAACLGTSPDNIPGGPAFIFGFVAQQGGVFFVGPAATVYQSAGWQPVVGANLVAADFTQVGGADHPDFSATGSPVVFGFTTASSGRSRTVYWGVDNFSVVPEPASTLLFLVGAGACALVRRQRR
jgi:hypothetical protein